MHDAPNQYAGQHLPFKQEGWGIAAFICVLAIVTALAAAWVTKTTYKHPTDVRFKAAGTSTPSAAH